MFRISLDSDLINTGLHKVPDPKLEFKHGCILGRINVPLGNAAVNMVAIPSFNGQYLVVSIPFSEVKGNITGKFFLSKLMSVFWGTISKQVEKMLVPRLQKIGLPRETVSIEKIKDKSGDVGKIKISMRCVNRWLAGKHPSLTPTITEISFSAEGMELVGDLEVN